MKFRVPANVDMPDRIIGGLTFRQLLILAADGVLIWLLYFTLGRLIPPLMFAAIALPLAAVGLAVATSTHSGIGIDRLALLAARFLLRPKRQVLAPEGLRRVKSIGGDKIDAIQIPLQGVTAEGLIDLGREGFAVICRASGLNLALRSEQEQGALVEAFGRFLNSLDGRTQFLARSHRMDLAPVLRELEERARELPHPLLEQASRAYAGFLRELAGTGDVLRREVLLCFHEAADSEDEAGSRLSHRVEQSRTLLRGLGISLRRLTADEAAHYVRVCGDPEGPQPPASDVSRAAIAGGRRR